jgi:hypothetical protein
MKFKRYRDLNRKDWAEITLARALFQEQRAPHYDTPREPSTSLSSLLGRTCITRRAGSDDWSMSRIALRGSENET